MKSFLVLFALVTSLGWADQAHAAYDTMCFSSCTTSIPVNSGHTGKRCNDDGVACNCWEANDSYGGAGPYKIVTPSTTCGANYMLYAYLINGYKCCLSTLRNEAPAERVESTSPEAATLSEIYSGGQRTAYFGYVDNNNRSPSTGRGQAAQAHLDACVGYANANLYTATDWNSYQACYSDCDTTKNGYCNDTGTNNATSMSNFRCKDRCDCVVDTNHAWSSCESL